MAEAILHIKDGYYFEVPKSFWRYESLQEIPQFLKSGHPHATLAEFQEGLNGKIIIPQPFGTLKNLHDKQSGFCISKFMILELVAAVFLIMIFMRLSKKISQGGPPRGRFCNLFEAILLFLRDDVARPAMGKHDADKFLPLLWTIFFFVLTCNLLGMVPWTGAPTGAFGVTLGMACVIFLTSFIGGMVKLGPLGFWLNFMPHIDLPWYLKPLGWVVQIVLLVIEIFGFCIKHGVLGIRLLANMVAGHIVLLGILGLIVENASSSTFTWSAVATISVISSTLFSCLELFVAFLQAYVFTFLSALFIGAAIHHH